MQKSNQLISAPALREALGGVSDMWLWRRLADPDMAFPRPIRIGQRRYWRECEIAAWIDAMAEASRGAA